MTGRASVLEARQYIESKGKREPTIGIILGSGLGELAEAVDNPVRIAFATIPHFPLPTVSGHTGTLVLGQLGGKNVAIMRGRIHYYEGYSMQQVTFPVRLLRELGCDSLVVTNASGGIRPDLRPGDMVRITDHINLMGDNPLRGHNVDEWGPRFPSMTAPYDRELGIMASAVAEKLKIPLRVGVFCAVTGPSYETRAEVQFMARNGADLVGMSTVPEVIVASHMGMRVLGISCVMNVVHGDAPAVTHEEVLQVAEQNNPRFRQLMQAIVEAMPAAVKH